MKEGLVIYCPTILRILAYANFMIFTKCLCTINPVYFEKVKSLFDNSKLEQVWWLINSNCNNCKRI